MMVCTSISETIGVLVLVVAQLKYVICIECLSCQYADTNTWQGFSCVSEPLRYRLGAATTQCQRGVKACYSYVEYYPDRSEIKYAYRGCSDRTKKEECVTVLTELHCTYVCSHDKCNTKDLIEIKPELIPGPKDVPQKPLWRRHRTTPAIRQRTTTRKPAPAIVTPAHSSDFVLCYSCTYNYHPEGDDSCVTSPSTTRQPNMVICQNDESHACAIRKQYALGDNVIRSYYRGCELVDTMRDSCANDIHFNTCFSYCQGELCNDAISIVNVAKEQAKDNATRKEKKKKTSKEVTSDRRNAYRDKADMASSRRRPGIGSQRRMGGQSTARMNRSSYLVISLCYVVIWFRYIVN